MISVKNKKMAERGGGPLFLKGLLFAGGMAFTGLAVLGIFLPLLPTTPFLLLAAACFVRSSSRLYKWLILHPWFGAYIQNYREHHAIPLRAKIFTLSLLWVTILASSILVARELWLKLFLIVIAVGVTIHLLKLKTLNGKNGKGTG